MIVGPSKYSKDLSIRPEGIALTLPVQFFEERGMTEGEFKPLFERHLRKEDTWWNFKLKNLPTIEVPYIYLIFDKHFQYRCNFMQYERNVSKSFADSTDGTVREFPNKNWILFTGTIIKAPEGWNQKGFQGFRYTTFLF